MGEKVPSAETILSEAIEFATAHSRRQQDVGQVHERPGPGNEMFERIANHAVGQAHCQQQRQQADPPAHAAHRRPALGESARRC